MEGAEVDRPLQGDREGFACRLEGKGDVVSLGPVDGGDGHPDQQAEGTDTQTSKRGALLNLRIGKADLLCHEAKYGSKKFDYDSSTVRKRFFREALLQIFIPYMLKQLGPSCASELPRFQELIFEDYSCFILVENIFEEVVLQSVMKDIMMTVKEAAVQRRHNLYRDSIVLSNSDPNLHLLGDNPSIDWAQKYGEGEPGEESDAESKRRRMKQVVSMIQEESPTFIHGESCVEVPNVNVIVEENADQKECADSKLSGSPSGMSSSSIVKEEAVKAEETPEEIEAATDGAPGEGDEGKEEPKQPVLVKEEFSEEAALPLPHTSNGSVLKGTEAGPEEPCEEDTLLKVGSDTESVKEEKQVNQTVVEEALPHTQEEPSSSPLTEEPPFEAAEPAPAATPAQRPHDDSGFQSPTNEEVKQWEAASCTPDPQPYEEPPMKEEMHKAVAANKEPGPNYSDIQNQ
ncbi:protein Niban 2 [Nematolebias whitei]|uniref:protein Niban 2 n=1 Tax=Nematolebias whitei TaxID=451745 RepID=UPI001896F4F5|nr:protein Niban 2 [Nematolebias whitei]